MRFEIAQSLNGNKIVYIARDTNGIVRLRNENLDALHQAILEYNEKLAKEAAEKLKAAGNKKTKTITENEKEENPEEKTEISHKDIEQMTEEESEEKKEEAEIEVPRNEPKTVLPQDTILEATVPDNEASQKKFLHSDIKEQIEDKKKKSGKKSFWDKLK